MSVDPYTQASFIPESFMTKIGFFISDIHTSVEKEEVGGAVHFCGRNKETLPPPVSQNNETMSRIMRQDTDDGLTFKF